MGIRARLRSGFSCDALATPEAKVICAALKKYGVILADVGRPWFLTGEANSEWKSLLGGRLAAFYADIGSMKGVDMEVVDPPGGNCQCTIAACLTELGTPQCPAPEPLGTVHVPPPSGVSLKLQTGLRVRALNGSSVLYNGTVDAGISTQYQDTWNNMREWLCCWLYAFGGGGVTSVLG
jgi:hypothetical protein